jgi:hypothetical protein
MKRHLADFSSMVMNYFNIALIIRLDYDIEDNFDDVGDKCHTPYVVAVRTLGLVKGISNNLPGSEDEHLVRRTSFL